MERKEISQAVISRLPRYYRYLGELRDEGVERISSQELSKKMRVTASQIRQDLNHFGGFGQQGYGYNVEYLFVEIAKILGLDQEHHLVLIGAGNLGQALLNYNNFGKEIDMVMAFDNDADKCDNNKIFHIDKMEELIKRYNIKIAIITTPKDSAQEVCDKLIEYGIEAIWNFAPITLKVRDNIVVKNEDLVTSLLILLKKLLEQLVLNVNL